MNLVSAYCVPGMELDRRVTERARLWSGPPPSGETELAFQNTLWLNVRHEEGACESLWGVEEAQVRRKRISPIMEPHDGSGTHQPGHLAG